MQIFREGAYTKEKIQNCRKCFYKQKQRYLAQRFLLLDISAERSSAWKMKLHLVAHSLRQPQGDFCRFS